LEGRYSIVDVPALVVAGIDEENFLPSKSEPGSKGATSWAGAYDYIFVVRKGGDCCTSDGPALC